MRKEISWRIEIFEEDAFDMLLRDRCWLWGHPEGCFNGKCGLTEDSRMTPMECCDYLNIGNTFMVPMGVKVDRRKYNK